MKIKTVDVLAGILNLVNFYRWENKELKVALTNNYLGLRKIVKQAQEDQGELIKKFQEDWKDEIAAVQEFRSKDKPVEGHEAYLKAETDGIEAISQIYETEADFAFITVDMDAFVSELNGEITPEQVAILADNGLFAQ